MVSSSGADGPSDFGCLNNGLVVPTIHLTEITNQFSAAVCYNSNDGTVNGATLMTVQIDLVM